MVLIGLIPERQLRFLVQTDLLSTSLACTSEHCLIFRLRFFEGLNAASWKLPIGNLLLGICSNPEARVQE